MRILVINPNTSDEMTDAIRVECEKAARGTTKVDVLHPLRGPRSIESYTEDYLASAATIELVLEHRHDYDAIVVACFDDPAVQAVRELVEVPVFGIAESAAHLASLVAARFSVVTVMRRAKPRLAESIARAGLADRCASIRAVEMSVLDIEADLDTTKALIEAEARRAMAEDDAEAIVLGCAGLGPLDKDLQAALGVPVLDGCACAVKLAEACVEYGITTSKYLSYAAPPVKHYDNWPEAAAAGSVAAEPAGPAERRPAAFNLAAMEAQRGPDNQALADRGWNVRAGDLDFPMMVLKQDAVRNNIDLMARYCRSRGVDLSPHAKTTMSPWLMRQQLDAGAWGMTVATPAQLKVCRQFGAHRILLANELVDDQAIAWVAQELHDPGFEFLCYVDSAETVRILSAQLQRAAAPRPVDVLVELGYPGGRTGARSVGQAYDVASAATASPQLNLRGISGFEGFFRPDDTGGILPDGRAYLADLRELATALHDSGLTAERKLVVTAGGSGYFDAVVEELGPQRFHFPVQTILRSGCYVSHDAEMYEPISPLAGRSDATATSRLAPALELWATVWSRPEPGLAIVGFGRRDAPSDFRMPVAQRVCSRTDRTFRDVRGSFEVTALNDQHAYVTLDPKDPLEVGDQVLFGVSHPCGAFDSWPWLPVVNDSYDVVRGVRTYF